MLGIFFPKRVHPDVLVWTDAWNSCRDLCLNELYSLRTQRHFLVCPFHLSCLTFFFFLRFRITLASAQVSSIFWEGTWNSVPCPPPAPLETVSSPCRLLLLLLEIVVHVSVISFKKTFFSFLSKKMFFVYFDRNECCCSAKIWSVVIKNKPVFVACVARIVRACEWIPSFSFF